MYCDGFDLLVLVCFDDYDGFFGVMFGCEGFDYYFEFIYCFDYLIVLLLMFEDLIVFYLFDWLEWEVVCECVIVYGFMFVMLFNLYWEIFG